MTILSPDQALDASAVAAVAEAIGAVAFEWRRAEDVVAMSPGAAALGLPDATPTASDWAAFVACFAPPDQAALGALGEGYRGHRVVVARLADAAGVLRWVRVRAVWMDEGRLAGLVVPAFGGEGETAEAADDGALSLEVRLRRAVADREFADWYQPIFALKTGVLAGFETLVRWPTNDQGLLGPDDFLPFADQLGLMPDIGAWIHAQACLRLAEWRTTLASKAPGFVSANASAPELERPGVVSQIAALIEHAALPSGAFKIEVTESHVMRDPERMRATLLALKEAGASLALDDFGAGFSSLAWLERFPFDVVKVDRYFIRTLAASDGSRRILASIVEIAHALGMHVVAEGVETPEEAERVAEMGCDFGQGFHYGPTLSAQDATRFMTALR